MDVGDIVSPVTFTISQSAISGNTARGAAGANAVPGQADGAAAWGSGGGVYTEMEGTASVSDATVAGNSAIAGGEGTGGSGSASAIAAGGGLWLQATGATVERTAITGNIADGTANQDEAEGGGVYVYSPATFVNSTVAGNVAKSFGNVAANGGGVFAFGPTTLAADTIASNTGTIGSNLDAFNRPVAVGATVIAAPAGSGANCAVQSGTIANLATPGDNLEDDAGASCGFSAHDGDIVGTAALLAPPAPAPARRRRCSRNPGAR